MEREPFIYREDGQRERFTPARAGQRLAGCLLCGSPIVCVGVFEPHDETTRNAVLRLRQKPLRPFSSPALFYGLCAEHTTELTNEESDRLRLVARVEDVIIALAARMRVH